MGPKKQREREMVTRCKRKKLEGKKGNNRGKMGKKVHMRLEACSVEENRTPPEKRKAVVKKDGKKLFRRLKRIKGLSEGGWRRIEDHTG
jgi:hypothetical protein